MAWSTSRAVSAMAPGARRRSGSCCAEWPTGTGLRAFGIAQQLQALGSGLLEHAAVDLVGLLAGGHVVLAVQLEAQDVAAHLLVEAGLGLLAQVAQLDQLGQHGGVPKLP
jgi:hypothetical protein